MKTVDKQQLNRTGATLAPELDLVAGKTPSIHPAVPLAVRSLAVVSDHQVGKVPIKIRRVACLELIFLYNDGFPVFGTIPHSNSANIRVLRVGLRLILVRAWPDGPFISLSSATRITDTS